MKKITISIFITALLLIIPTLLLAQMTTVKGDKVNSRKGPGTKYTIKWEYGDGLPLKIIQHKKNWVKIKDFENDTGWIHKSLLHYNPHVIVKANRGKKKKINIRSGPSTKNKIIGEAFYGVVFQTVERKSGWIKVKHQTGLQGWVNENLLWGY